MTEETIVDYKALAIEARRLKDHRSHRKCSGVGIFALLINSKVSDKNASVEFVLRADEADRLMNFCRIIVRRFGGSPTDDLKTVTALARFAGPMLIGQWFMARAILETHQNKVNSELFDGLENAFGDLFRVFVLYELQSTPEKICREFAYNMMKIPRLSVLVTSGCSVELLKYLIRLPAEVAASSIRECLGNEKFFGIFAEMMFQEPEFFAMIQYMVPDVSDVFARLMRLDDNKFIKSFVSNEKNLSGDVRAEFWRVVSDEKLVMFVESNEQSMKNVLWLCAVTGRLDLLDKIEKEQNGLSIDALKYVFRHDYSVFVDLVSKSDHELLLSVAEEEILECVERADSKSLIVAMMRKEAFIERLIERKPGILVRCIAEDQTCANLLCHYYRNGQDRLKITDMAHSDSIPYAVFRARTAEFMELLTPEEAKEFVTIFISGNIADVIDDLVMEDFFKFVWSSESRQGTAVSLLSDSENVRESKSWSLVIEKIPEALILTCIALKEDYGYVYAALSHFCYMHVDDTKFATMIEYLSHYSDVLQQFELSVQVSIFRRLMHLLKDGGYIIPLEVALNFLSNSGKIALFRFIDDDMRDNVYEVLITPLARRRNVNIYRLMWLMYVDEPQSDTPRSPRFHRAVVERIDTEIIEPWVYQICTDLDPNLASQDQIKHSIELVQHTITNTELGYDTRFLELCYGFFERMFNVEFHLFPALIRALWQRVSTLHDNPEQEELVRALLSLITLFKRMPDRYLESLSAIVASG